jgi:hypothetical protein
MRALIVLAVLTMAGAAWGQCKTDAQGDCVTTLAPGQPITPDGCASIGKPYDGTSRFPRCVEPGEATAYAQAQAAQANAFIFPKFDGPSEVTFPNGWVVKQLSDNTVWATIQGADEAVSFQLSRDFPLSGTFQTNVVMNLPVSDVVGAPLSVKMEMYGDCQSKTYRSLGIADYSGKMGSGTLVGVFKEGFDYDDVLRRVMPGGALDKVFKRICKP